jgi:endonuclease/exonuclease/phosphatase family metal-dependent hydrolase
MWESLRVAHDGDHHPRRSDRSGGAWRAIRYLAAGLLVLALVAMTAGALLTDRWAWSQWIWWIPRGALVVASLPALLVAFATRGPRRFAWLIPSLVPLVWLALADIGWRGWPGGAQAPAAIHLIHWNASWPGSRAGAPASAELLARDADIIVVSNAYKLLGDGRVEIWRDAGYEIVQTGPFLVASRWPVLEARVVSAVERRLLGRVRIAVGGRDWTIVVVDLPSDARISRSQLAESFRREALPHFVDTADLVVGDFNITRGSASIRIMFPNFRHAFDEAGIGFGATWPQRLPFMHLDHMLLANATQCHAYRIFAVGSRPHRAQEALISVGP